MKFNKTHTAAVITTLFISASALASKSVEWSYSGETGPEVWGSLDESFETCATGKKQSPVNITSATDDELSPLTINYNAGGFEALNNGHTIQVNYLPGSSIIIGNKKFELKQFHFHSPSENMIDNEQYPMEAHFVHANESGHLAVIGVMYESGDEVDNLSALWEALPAQPNQKQSIVEHINAKDLLPNVENHYRFEGSLTTPPCSEEVLWIVLDETQAISTEQLKAFSNAVHVPNNRPVQPLNGRVIYQQ